MSDFGSKVRKYTFVLLPLIATCGVISVWHVPNTPTLNFAKTVCSESGQFVIGGSKDKEGVMKQQDGFNFQGLSWLALESCGSGMLTLVGDGQVAGGEAPRLDITLDGLLIASESFSTPRTVRLAVPRPGRIALAFVNDYFKADVRLALFLQPRVDSANCRTFSSVTVPFESAGSWDEINQIGSVVRSTPPITMRPCGAGSMNIALKGQSSQGQFPRLVFKQLGRIVDIYQTTADYKRVSFKISSDPIELAMANPYAKLVGDRNLYLRKAIFEGR